MIVTSRKDNHRCEQNEQHTCFEINESARNELECDIHTLEMSFTIHSDVEINRGLLTKMED